VHSTFFLQPHAFLGSAKRHWVILDVNRDKYLCVDRRQFESLGPWLYGWEETALQRECSASAPSDEAIALAHRLLSLDLLSERADGAKPARTLAYPLPTDSMIMDVAVPSRRSSCAHAPSFFLSSAKAARQLRDQCFQSIVAFVRARKHHNANPSRPLDFERAHFLVSVFDSLRLFFPRPYLCLFDSLALIHFLARFKLYPDWVFGVSADPFEAHCWVQAGSVVLNDTIARVSAFTPIMCV
jgi:hypothetical protein